MTLESLNLNTGFQAVVNMREKKVEELARKYRVDLSEFQKAEMLAQMDEDEEFYPPIESN